MMHVVSEMMLGLVLMVLQAASPGLGTSHRELIPGPRMRSLADSSKYLKIRIWKVEQPSSPWKLEMHVDLQNLTGNAIHVNDALLVYDVYDVTIHQRAADTAMGCFVNFMSPCYRGRRSVTNGAAEIDVQAHKNFNMTVPVDAAYQITTGHTYKIQGYFCTEKREGEEGECIKSNIVQLTQP